MKGRRLLVCAAAGLIGGVAAPALAQAPTRATRLSVRSLPRIESVVRRAPGGFDLDGTLVDDAARGLPDERITIRVESSDSRGPLTLSGADVRACVADSPKRIAPPTVDGGGQILVTTDSAGRFCVNVRAPGARGKIHQLYSGRGFLETTSSTTEMDLGRKSVRLLFDPPPKVVSLDAAATSIEIVATVESTGGNAPLSGATLLVHSDKGPATRAMSNSSGRVTFSLERDRLGPPGPGELRVVFEGTDAAAPAEVRAPLEKHVTVSLALVRATFQDSASRPVPLGEKEPFEAQITTSSSAGTLPDLAGSVEALVDGVVIAAAPVVDGVAILRAAHGRTDAEALPLVFRFSPARPWYQPGAELSFVLAVKSPGLIRRAPFFIVTALVLLLFALGRRGRKVIPPKAESTPEHPPRAPKVEWSAPARDHGQAPRAWTGCVLDAEDGTPVSRGTVALLRPTFQGMVRLEQAETDSAGRFVLAATAWEKGDRLEVAAPFHRPLEDVAPPPGDLRLHLVLRKRAVLDDLLRKLPTPPGPRPTPAEIARTSHDVALRRFALAVEEAAYDCEPVDAARDAHIKTFAPPGVDAGGGASV